MFIFHLDVEKEQKCLLEFPRIEDRGKLVWGLSTQTYYYSHHGWCYHTHTCELKDLHLWFEFTFWFVFFLCNLHLWFFHHRNVRRPHTLKKQNVLASKSLSHMKTIKPCVMVLLFFYLPIAKWYTCTNKK